MKKEFAEFWGRYASRLVGRRIVGLLVDDSDSDIGAVPGFRLDDGTLVFVLQDPEGNGPGFLEFQATVDRG